MGSNSCFIPWRRGVLGGLFALAVTIVHATDYKFIYCYEDHKWMYQIGKTEVREPPLNRGDRVSLYVIQNTLRTQVKVNMAQELFGSTVPDILKKLLPGGSANALTERNVMARMAAIVPVVVEELRSTKPRCELADQSQSTGSKTPGEIAEQTKAAEKVQSNIEGHLRTAISPVPADMAQPTADVKDKVATQSAAEATKPTADGKEKVATQSAAQMLDQKVTAVVLDKWSTFDVKSSLSEKIRTIAGVAYEGDPSPGNLELYLRVIALADLVKQWEDGTLYQSGPYEVEPDQDLLTISMTFTDVPAPTFTQGSGGGNPNVVGGPGAPAGGNPAAGQQALVGASAQGNDTSGEVLPADKYVTRSYYLGSRGLRFAKPSYSAGLSYSTMVDEGTRKVTAGGTTTVEPGAKNDWKVVPSAFMHLNVYNTPDLHIGPALGVLYSGENLVSYFGGFSVQLGRRTRLSLNAGWQFGEVDVLDGVKFGDPVTADQTVTRKVWRSKFLFGVSYSF